jgi:hypothetical protein
MSDAAAPAPAKASKPKAPRKPSAHPPTSEMVMKALVTLKDRKGSSLPAIKKYIAANYKVRELIESLLSLYICHLLSFRTSSVYWPLATTFVSAAAVYLRHLALVHRASPLAGRSV